MQDAVARAEHFGSNHRDPLVAESCCSMFWGALDDFMLKLLVVCAVVSITLDTAMAAPEDKLEPNVHHNHLLVGDLIKLKYGMQIPVDGILVEKSSNLTSDESAMTGESEELIKDTNKECLLRMKEAESSGKTTTITNTHARRTMLPSPIMMSGTSVAQGEGMMMAIMVGEESCLGKIIAKLADKDAEKTPLQVKLEEIAEDIGKLGTIFAVMTFHVLMLRFIFEGLVW